ncbi:MAG: hypothetical protein WBB98_12035 [Xanthobacteraceae bacterium]
MSETPALRIPVRYDLSAFASDTGKVKGAIEGTTQKTKELGAAQDRLSIGQQRAREASQRYVEQLSEQYRQITLLQNRNRELVAMQERYVAVIDMSSRSVAASNDNFRMSGLEMASLTRHAKQAAVALYALSPAFRALVNPAITAGVKASNQALVAMGPAAASASLAVVRGFSPVVAAISRVLLPLSLMKTGLDLTTEAWDLGGKKLDDYRAIAEKAAAVDLSTSYFQRITKAATDAKTPVDTLTKALQNMQAATMEQLGGSVLDKRLNEHLKAGNFAGNSGVAAIGQANTTEDQFKAVIKLIDEAMAKGQRLAALDIANTVFGPDITARLRQNSEYLHDLQASAEKISATQLVSDADVGRALELQRRYEAAVAILSERWHPIQGALTALGIQMQSAWVGIVESIANAVDGAARLVMKIAEIPTSFWSYIAKGASAVASVAPAIGGLAGPVGLGVGVAVRAGAGLLGGAAKDENQLADAIKNANNVRAAGALGLKVYDNVIKDTSKALGDHAEKQQQAANAYERAEASVMKHIARMEADRKAVGLGVGGLEELRTAALLNTAAMQAGLPMTQALADKMQDLAQDAGYAAQKLAEDRAMAQALFDLQTAGLSGVEQQIAQLNYRLHGDDWKAYADSSVAATMRLAAALRTVPTNDNEKPADEEKREAA